MYCNTSIANNSAFIFRTRFLFLKVIMTNYFVGFKHVLKYKCWNDLSISREVMLEIEKDVIQPVEVSKPFS